MAQAFLITGVNLPRWFNLRNAKNNAANAQITANKRAAIMPTHQCNSVML